MSENWLPATTHWQVYPSGDVVHCGLCDEPVMFMDDGLTIGTLCARIEEHRDECEGRPTDEH